MKIVDIANEIFEDAGSPTNTSIPAIAFWIRSKVGAINNLLFEDFSISADTFEILDPSGAEITPEAVAVIKQLYRIYDYEKQIRDMMNALANDTLLSVKEFDGSSFTRVNRNEVAKTLAAIRNTEIKSLSDLVTAYRGRTTAPQGIVGDDFVQGVYPSTAAYYRRT